MGDVKRAREKNAIDLARINKNKEVGQEQKADFEASMEKKLTDGVAWRDAKLAECDAEDAEADEDKEKKLARIAEMQENEEEEHEKEIENLTAAIADTKATDQAKYDAVADEIKVVAEELLVINEKMNVYLTKMCEL